MAEPTEPAGVDGTNMLLHGALPSLAANFCTVLFPLVKYLTMNSATALMTSHNTEGSEGCDHLTMNSVTALMTSHTTEGSEGCDLLTMNTVTAKNTTHTTEGREG
jgi:hypothetical protein